MVPGWPAAMGTGPSGTRGGNNSLLACSGEVPARVPQAWGELGLCPSRVSAPDSFGEIWGHKLDCGWCWTPFCSDVTQFTL